jgi:hypothetical protein
MSAGRDVGCEWSDTALGLSNNTPQNYAKQGGGGALYVYPGKQKQA